MTIKGFDLDRAGHRAVLAGAIYAIGGKSVGGLWLRARPGPVRDAYMSRLRALLPDLVDVTPAMDDTALFGGLDVTASLAAGKKVLQKGRVAGAQTLALAGADRTPPALAARLALCHDREAASYLLIDEGQDGEAPPACLWARTGLTIGLEGLRPNDLAPWPTAKTIARARTRLAETTFSAGKETDLVEIGAAFSVSDARLCVFAHGVARAAAALGGRAEVSERDLDSAALLSLAPRGLLPQIEPEKQPEVEKPPAELSQKADTGEGRSEELSDRVVSAVTVALPEEAFLGGDLAHAAPSGSGAGAKRRSSQRGRPLPSRPGRPGSGRRLDPVATLRAAAPWQRLRAPSLGGQSVTLRPSDLSVKRHEARSERLVIFAVDASGSQAMARMAEAKGAVEFLLAEAYRRRDRVALLAFRGEGAEILLPPTGALVRARKALANLPGGGGTPLAAGLDAAATLALQAARGGATPFVVLLTDGRANVALDGSHDRAAAAQDADNIAKRLATERVGALVVDTGRRPEPQLGRLAGHLGGTYLALPQADAARVADAVSRAADLSHKL
ncbi:MAG: VWA domain-containing protein [Pseudomonadota bacterium]